MEPLESGLYNFSRRVLRLWFGMIFRRVRVLQEESLPQSGPVLLIVNHPSGFAHALILVAALRRQVHCLLERSLLEGPLGGAAARVLGMIPYEPQGEDWPAALESVCRVFSRGGTVLIFTGQRRACAGELRRGFAPEAAEVALEAEAYLSREAPLPVFPVHMFLPVPPSGAGELLVHIDHTISSKDAPWRREEDLDRGIVMLDKEIEKACCESPFRLQPDQVQRFIGGLETVMREDFAESWSHRENWKQKVEDFDLSPFLIRLTHHLNYRHPGRLAALSVALRGYEERKRRAALRAFRVETAGPWQRVWWRKLAVWAETIAGCPVACYGLLNLLIAWLILRAAGLLRKGLWEATPKEWAKRVAITLICYAGQIGLAAHFLPRAAAGYYVPSLLISGPYVLRYAWLLEHRSSILAGAFWAGEYKAGLQRMRKALIAELKQDQDRYAATWEIAH